MNDHCLITKVLIQIVFQAFASRKTSLCGDRLQDGYAGL